MQLAMLSLLFIQLPLYRVSYILLLRLFSLRLVVTPCHFHCCVLRVLVLLLLLLLLLLVPPFLYGCRPISFLQTPAIVTAKAKRTGYKHRSLFFGGIFFIFAIVLFLASFMQRPS